MKVKKADWISLIEAGYSLEGDDQQWLDQVFECAKPLFDPIGAPDAWIFSVTPTTFALGIGRTSRMAEAMRRKMHEAASPATIDFMYRTGWAIATASEVACPLIDHLKLAQKAAGKIDEGSSDLIVVRCFSGTGWGVGLTVALPERRGSTILERKRWSQVAAHLGAGLRLRKFARELSLDADLVEAVLDSSGNLHDASARAAEATARENLREAVRRIEHARTIAGRDEADAALDNWHGLVDGRWSLVDRFDTDGKRFVVAVKNDPAHPDPRGLTPGERQVAEYVGMGRSTKEIGYILGVSDAAVTNSTARVEQKLGLSSRAEITSFFAQSGLRRRLAEVAFAEEQLLIGAYPLIDATSVSCLTQAEREVTAQIIAGSTNFDIAARRGSSVRTIANQINSIFTKLNVRSRSELAARLQARDQ
jgi:DNA-binding CsgD family transcriptional regulator